MENGGFEGSLFAHYRVERKLGQGGMGVVYRAEDTRLHRPVAIKFLTREAGAKAELRERFLEEARSASALNHPNIVTIYEIGRHEDSDFIAMEFVPGKTLHDLIHRGGLTLSETLKYAVQIADAMAAAHAVGVVHRDLKPANILINERGQVKIVDFGLAKRADRAPTQDEATRTILQAHTMEGTTVGTASYMSPEQAEGKRVDARSDIFAFGTILYEMVTGRRAFEADNPISTLVAVASKDPPPIQWPGAGPNELDRVIWRCLRKDPERRVQHAGDLALILEEIRDAWERTRALAPAASPLDSTVSPPAGLPAVAPVDSAALAAASAASGRVAVASVATPPPSSMAALPAAGPRWIGWAIGGILAVAAGTGFYAYRTTKQPAANTGPMSQKRITSDDGLAAWPALSPDGKWVAYASDRGDEDHVHLWLQLVEGGSPIRLSGGVADDTEPAFSPDGSKVVYHSDRDGGGVYVVPIPGGESRLVVANGRRPRFSPDGSQILYWEGGDLGAIHTVDLNGGNQRSLQGKFHSARYPVWSPDGKAVMAHAYHAMKPPGDADWWVIPVNGGEPIKTGIVPALQQQKLRQPSVIGDLVPAAWMPDNRIVFTARSEDAVGVWTIPIDPTSMKVAGPARVLNAGTQDGYPAVAADERGLTRLAFASLTRKINLWKVALDPKTGMAGDAPPERVTRSGNDATQVSISADGKRIAFLWDRDQVKPSLWVRDMDTGRQVEIPGPTSKDGSQWTPALKPDGTALIWSVYEGGRIKRTYRNALGDGTVGPPELLCEPCGSVAGWSMKPEMYFYSDPQNAVHAVDVATNKDTEVLRYPDGAVWGARPSPDVRWLTFNATSGHSESRLFIAPFDPARPRAVPFEQWIPISNGKQWDDKPRWAADGRSVYYLSSRDGFRCVWRQTLDGVTRRPKGEPVAVAHFHGARLSMMNVNMGPLSIAVGPDALVVSLAELTGQVWTATPKK